MLPRQDRYPEAAVLGVMLCFVLVLIGDVAPWHRGVTLLAALVATSGGMMWVTTYTKRADRKMKRCMQLVGGWRSGQLDAEICELEDLLIKCWFGVLSQMIGIASAALGSINDGSPLGTTVATVAAFLIGVIPTWMLHRRISQFVADLVTARA